MKNEKKKRNTHITVMRMYEICHLFEKLDALNQFRIDDA